MPSVGLSEFAALRMQAISFFLMGLLLSALVIKWVWNGLQRDFPRLPRLSYARACGVVVLWGLLFVVVLTMISGARELMTPGAWIKSGITYRLPSAESPSTEPDDELLAARRARLMALGGMLQRYAVAHGGQFPAHDDVPEIPGHFWELPDPSGLRYIYVSGRRLSDSSIPLVHEPAVYADDPLVLLTDGTVARMKIEALTDRRHRSNSGTEVLP
jgi:hypothetical protein